RCLLLATFGCYEAVDDAADRALLCAIAIADQSPEHGTQAQRPRCSVAVDCGWFETSTFSCVLPDGSLLRRQLVSSVARDVVVKLAPLGDVVNERILVTSDALRNVDPETIRGRIPIIADHLKFDARTRLGKASRRSSVFVFAIPPLNNKGKMNDRHSTVTVASQPILASELRKNEAHAIADGFQLMVNAQYADAETYFRSFLERSAMRSALEWKWNRTFLRLLAISSAIANVQRFAPGAVLAPYYRGECPLFETSAQEQEIYRGKQNENRSQRNFISEELGAEGAATLAAVMESTHRGSAGVSVRKKLREARKASKKR
ncbi:Hypothetical protein, putative, partial [Bodo saltans]